MQLAAEFPWRHSVFPSNNIYMQIGVAITEAMLCHDGAGAAECRAAGGCV